MTIGSLFSGIGGLELGLEWAGLGPVVWQVEKSEKRRNSLGHHWPAARRFEDVCTVGKAELEPVDLICGGFPCQDISSLGKRAGLTGARSGLWGQFSRILDELKPRWVVIENVASGATKWVDEVRASLERKGYASLPVPLSAFDVGAPHKYRRRIFLVANLKSLTKREQNEEADTIPGGWESWEILSSRNSTPPDVDSTELWNESGRSCGEGRQGSAFAAKHHGWDVEPDVARVVHGFPGRVDRECALGDSVVPQCAEVIGWIIRELSDR